MDIIAFDAGSEKRFSEFISHLDESKVALVSHNDTDGVSSAKVANFSLQADILKFVDYQDLNDNLVQELQKAKVERVIFTDLFMEKDFVKKIEKFAEVLIIDHHLFKEDLNSDKTFFLNAQGYCGAYLCYYLFSKIRDLSHLDWLVAVASVADWQYMKNSSWLSEVYKKYGDTFTPTITGVKESTKFWPLVLTISQALIYHEKNPKNVYDGLGKGFGDIGTLQKDALVVKNEIDLYLAKFDKEKQAIQDGYFWEFSPRFSIKAFLSTSLSASLQDKTFIFAIPGEKYYYLSARRQDGKVNVADLLASLVKGFEDSSAGGHFKAAGGHVLIKDKEAFKKKLFSL